MEQNQNKTQTN